MPRYPTNWVHSSAVTLPGGAHAGSTVSRPGCPGSDDRLRISGHIFIHDQTDVNWCAWRDSNSRRISYELTALPLSYTRALVRRIGAGNRNRTGDLLHGKQTLCP